MPKKYTISGQIIFEKYEYAKAVFELLKKQQAKFVDLDLEGDITKQEKTSVNLIETDHELLPADRKGSVLLEKMDSKTSEVLVEK